MESVHLESRPVELGETGSDNYRCVGKFLSNGESYVVWYNAIGRPRWILDEETPGNAETKYRRVASGDSTAQIFDAMGDIDRPFRP